MIPPSVLVALLTCAVLNLTLALRLLLRPARQPADGGAPPPPLGLERVGLAALGVAGLTLLQLPLLMLLVGLKPFGMLHLAWLDVSAVVPLSGLGLLLARGLGRPVSRAATGLACLSLLALPLSAYTQLVEPYDLRVERVDVALDPARVGAEPIVLGVLADVQTPRVGAYERDAVQRLMQGRPDIILVPGDLYQGPAEAFDEVLPGFQQLLAGLHAPGGVWVVPGNTDDFAGLPRMLAGTSARLLRDEVVHLTVRDRRVALLGLDENQLSHGARREIPALRPFETAPGDDEIRIVLSHRPRVVSALQTGTRIDLVVAGHTHGGQVALPFLGPPIVLSPLPNRVGAGGLHDLDGRRVDISRGVGMERDQAPRIRFLVPPEVSLLTLRTDAP